MLKKAPKEHEDQICRALHHIATERFITIMGDHAGVIDGKEAARIAVCDAFDYVEVMLEKITDVSGGSDE